MTKTVVILGGSFAGLHVMHALLKNDAELRVVLVSRSSHFFWCLASVRAVVPGQFMEDQYFGSLATAVARYPPERAELVVGSATSIDAAAQTVTVDEGGGGGATRILAYDQLVVATGARVRQPLFQAAAGAMGPWKGGTGSFEQDAEAIRTVQDKVRAAQRIVVAGGGATGVEVAGELACEYGSSKEVILLASGEALLGREGGVAAPAALAELQKLRVDVRLKTGVAASRVLPDGRVELIVAGEPEPLVTDVYLAAYGIVPNSEFIDDALLDPQTRRVRVDACFRVAGIDSGDVWALGDVVGKPRDGFIITQKQAAGVAKNILLALHDAAPVPIKLPPVDFLAVAVGRSRGTGRFGFVRLPSLLIWLLKGRTLGTQALPAYMDGSIA